MIQIRFKNLERSELAKEAVFERLTPIFEKFNELQKSKVTVTLEMENSPTQAGPDVFNVMLHVANGKFKAVTVTKSDSNLYKALADLSDHMLERLNRFDDKERVKERTKARKLIQALGQKIG